MDLEEVQEAMEINKLEQWFQIVLEGNLLDQVITIILFSLHMQNQLFIQIYFYLALEHQINFDSCQLRSVIY
jgi:hypothetical protein